MRLAPFSLALVLVLAACAVTKEGKVAQLQATYTEAAHTLVNLRTAGKIDDATWPRVKAADAAAWQALEDYKNGVGTREAVLHALSALENFLVQGVN